MSEFQSKENGGMEVSIKNIGVIKQAKFSLNELTILCGKNNTGKTYATYALFGFLSFWHDAFPIMVDSENVLRLLNAGSVDLDIQEYVDAVPSTLKNGCNAFTKNLSRVFASSEKYFSESHFSIALGENDIQPLATFERTMKTEETQVLSISKKADSPKITVSLLMEKGKSGMPRNFLGRIIGDALKEIIFGNLFPRPFIASAERTGAAIFRKELNFARNRLLEEMGSTEKDVDPFKLFSKVYADYALPVKSNVDFTRKLETLTKNDSFIAKEHPEILDDFADIIGGDYLVTKHDELYFAPRNGRIKLTMDESSSAVRSLLDIGFYLRHAAVRGDLLMVDEPELNLHPENQRRMAKLFARLINIGVKVFITTHSDYIIKELNTLIMLNQGGERLRRVAEQEKYKSSELLNPEKVHVYMAEEAPVMLDGMKRKTKCQTLVRADIDAKFGIEARSFDETIETMNRIQEEIVWGGDA